MYFCDTPRQSALAAVGGGLAGGVAGLAFGLDVVGTGLLAGGLAGVGDLLAHLVRGDPQFQAAVARLR